MTSHRIPGPQPGEALFIESRESGVCDVHTWTDEYFLKHLVERLRATHGRGGTTVCSNCIERLKKLNEGIRKCSKT